jgi:hypothetical protein
VPGYLINIYTEPIESIKGTGDGREVGLGQFCPPRFLQLRVPAVYLTSANP